MVDVTGAEQRAVLSQSRSSRTLPSIGGRFKLYSKALSVFISLIIGEASFWGE